MVPKEHAEKNSRLKILRKRLEQNFQKYFWDLCEVGDANKDGNIDMNEWLDVMSEIVEQVKDRNTFPEWYEGLHKALFRSNEFFGIEHINILFS
jgi:Ca2+-binding EF-hand superfamily protein